MAAKNDITTLFEAGAHFGYSRARRHPSAGVFLFGTKDRSDIFDLEETKTRLEAACAFAESLGKAGKTLVFVGGKPEAASIMRELALLAGTPYVTGRWIGGTLTNFKNIRKRIERLARLSADKESGNLEKYTKRERLLIDRDIEKLEHRFGGLATLADLPAALFVVDTRHEETAVEEAKQLKIPVIGLSSSDCDFAKVKYPVPGNDAAVKTIRLVAHAITDAYMAGKRAPSAPALNQADAQLPSHKK